METTTKPSYTLDELRAAFIEVGEILSDWNTARDNDSSEHCRSRLWDLWCAIEFGGYEARPGDLHDVRGGTLTFIETPANDR